MGHHFDFIRTLEFLTCRLSCVSQLAHQPPPVADLLNELEKSGALSRGAVEEILELYILPSVPSAISSISYSRIHRFTRVLTQIFVVLSC